MVYSAIYPEKKYGPFSAGDLISAFIHAKAIAQLFSRPSFLQPFTSLIPM
jgi:hypothetical protein